MKPWKEDARFKKASRVSRVVLEREGDNLQLQLHLSTDVIEMRWRFAGVTQLRFRGEATDLQGLVLLEAEDITQKGWEGARFRIRDIEEEFISFLCSDVAEVTSQ